MPTELIDGAPFFAEHEGQRLNRKQWLAATKDQRKEAFIAELRAASVEPDEELLDMYDVVEDEETAE